MTLVSVFAHVSLIANFNSVPLVITSVDHLSENGLSVLVVAANGETFGHFEWQRDAATVYVTTSQDHVFCTLSIDCDDQFPVSWLEEILDAPLVSFLARHDRPSNLRWFGLKGSQALPYGSVAGSSLFSSNNMKGGGSQGNSGFSTNSRVD